MMENFKPFETDDEIEAFFREDDGKNKRLEALGMKIVLLSKRTDVQMQGFSRRIVTTVFSQDYVLTHAWRVNVCER